VTNASAVVKLVAAEIVCETAYNISAGSLYLSCPKVTGTRTGTPVSEISNQLLKSAAAELSTPLPLTSGGTGASTQDAARAALGLAAVAVPPIRIYHPHLTFTATDVVETGTGATTVNGLFDLRSGATAGSRVRWRPTSDSISVTNFCTTFANWTRRVQFSGQIKFVLLPALMTNYYIFGKTPSAGFGKVAAGDYVGVTLIAESMTEGFVCKSGVVVSVPFTPVVRDGSAGLHFSIISENGTVQFYVNGALAGSTADGPVNANATGTINIELDSGAANSIMQCVTYSDGW
jgi:hypothetical protein